MTTARATAGARSRYRSRAEALLARPWHVARLLSCGIVLFGVLGVVQRLHPDDHWLHVVDLDFEWVPPALFSALLDAAACAAFVALVRRGVVPRAGAAVAAVLGLMALDEWFGLHEHLEVLTGVDWQTLYAPVFLAAGVAGLLLLRSWGRRLPAASLLFVGGGVLWAVAQVLEHLEFVDGDQPVAHYDLLSVPEELLEMTGSMLFLLCGLVVLRAVGTRPRA